MTVEKISAITFRVANMTASVRFYRDVLGMEIIHGRIAHSDSAIEEFVKERGSLPEDVVEV